jgi:CRISPR-associated endonuclease/helicase Cas3
MKLATLPAYSKMADDTAVEQAGLTQQLPQGWRLSQHQLETYQALTAPHGPEVVFNTAMTGDGKSLAAFLRALQDDDHAIAMYPTNELIRDQAGKMPEYLAKWRSNARYAEMYGARITELIEETSTEQHRRSRVQQIRKLLDQNNLLLTNPDLFHLMMNFKLGSQAWERKELPFEVPANFDYFVFDEFHVFGVPQVIDVVNVINYLAVQYRHRPADVKRVLFLSATPHPLMQRLLAQSGLRVVEFTGQYSSTPGDDWRPLLQACELHLDAVSRDRTAEAWVQEHLVELIQLFRDHPGSKGAIIVNSAATAKRLRVWLENNLPPGITVGENTGLTSREERQASFERSLLVGTSTVDIGVDFRINLLIFEATSAGTFIQRFGRLGRHTGFDTYRAYGLLPKFILERLETALAGQSELERGAFHQIVYDVYPQEQEFRQYARRWGVLQTAHLVAQTQQALPKDTPFIADLIAQYNQVFEMSPAHSFERVVKRYWAMTHKEADRAVLDELTSFRGRSPLSCCLWDLTDDTLKTYDLLFLLANAEFEVISEDEFIAVVHQRNLAVHEFRYQLLCIKLHRYVPEREYFTLGLKRDLLNHEEWLHQAQAFKGFYIKESRQPWTGAVNRVLKKQRLVCVLSDKPARELKRHLWLPFLFPVYRLLDLYESEFSVVFGKEALLLESLLFYRRTAKDMAIIL